jgi:MATE family multidrug resistance protein
VRLAWPITISMMSFSAMTLASTAFVAQVGSDELAGVGLGGVANFTMICFGIGLLRGGKTLISQAIGANRRDLIPELLGAAVAIALVLGATALIAGQIAAPLLALLSASPRAGELASEYLAIRSFGMPLVLIACALREASYAEGNSRAPMRSTLWGNGVNIALDALLITALGMGVQGAALATIAGIATELATLAWPMRAKLRAMVWRRSAVRSVLQQGVPNGVQFIMEVGSFMILTVLVAQASAIDGAAHQMVLHLINVSFLPAHALAEAAAVLVGRAVGANRDALVSMIAKRALAIAATYSTLCVVAYAILGGIIVDAMAAGDAALSSRATTLVHIGTTFLVADAANVIARGVLRGASDVRFAAVVGIVTAWLATPPLGWYLGIHHGLGAAGGWIGLTLEIVVGAGILWARVWREGWKPAAAKARRQITGTV